MKVFTWQKKEIVMEERKGVGLVAFYYGGFQVRKVEVDGEPWFVAKDVAEALGYQWQPNLASHVPNEWADIKPINVRSENGVEQNRDMLCL
jgi:prophage antirepressor-like protein